LFAELMGRATGVCGGRGGSQHLHWNNFYSNGILGGGLPIAAGAALAEKQKDSHAITVAFLGDGTLGEGVLYESLNLASLWSLPILYVLENNHIAQTTPIELALAGDIAARFEAFGIPASRLDTSDVLAILTAAQELAGQVRVKCAPRALIIDTCRFGPHSKGDDTRPLEQVEHMRQERDPLKIQAARLDPSLKAALDQSVNKAIETAFRLAQDDPFPELGPDTLLSPANG
jgi:TPP-dependent pyruvate/acetoin dehydrogenase alpha subunit